MRYNQTLIVSRQQERGVVLLSQILYLRMHEGEPTLCKELRGVQEVKHGGKEEKKRRREEEKKRRREEEKKRRREEEKKRRREEEKKKEEKNREVITNSY